MKSIIILSLLFTLACSKSGGGGGSSSPKPSNPTAPNLEIVELTASSSDTVTKNSSSIITIQTNREVERIKIFTNSACSTLVQEIFPNTLQFTTSLNLSLNQINDFYFSVLNEENDTLLNCQKKLSIKQDQIKPNTPAAEFFLSQSANTSASSILTGGVASDFSEEISAIRYYLYNSISDTNPIFILQATPSSFIAKTISLPILQGTTNYFKFTLIDLAGNESSPQGAFAIFNQTSSVTPKVVLDYELSERNNSATNQASIDLKGFAHLQSTGIDIYRNDVLINSITAPDFNAGVSVPLIVNSLNTFKFINKQNAQSSLEVILNITHDNIKPNPPILDPEVFIDASEDYELSEATMELYGTASEELSAIYVYTDSNLSEVYSLLDIFGLQFTGEVGFYTFGENTFYAVAVDKAGNLSNPVSVTFTHLDYDLPE